MEDKAVTMSWLRGPCIGRGAYGTVDVAVNISDGHLFAVKSVNLATALPSQVHALENEITILKSLSSPFIVSYIGDDTTAEGSPPTSFRNMHMEYLPTGSFIDSDEAEVASFTWCLVSALSYLHSRGIMHCDVKGSNVLLGPSSGSAKLADFGSAAEISSAGSVSPRGSPLWMAPEVMRGEHQGLESDVWSLGCTVIEMLTGKPAWGAEANSVYRIGYSEELPLFPARLSWLGADFLDKCLRRDYTERWSCDQLLQHPFLTMRSQRNTANHPSPRCVLDFFSAEEEEQKEEEVNLGANERIRELVSEGGVNWESEGWVVVRGGEGTRPEYLDLSEDRFGDYSVSTDSTSSDLNLLLLAEDHSYTTVNDVVWKEYVEMEHFNCDNNHVKRFYSCTNYIYWGSIYFLCSQFQNLSSLMRDLSLL